MYDPATVPDAIEAHRVAVPAGLGLVMARQNPVMITAVVMAKRNGVLPRRHAGRCHRRGVAGQPVDAYWSRTG